MDPEFQTPASNNTDRVYRGIISGAGLVGFRVVVKETDLFIHAESDLSAAAREAVIQHRGYLEAYIRRYPRFASTQTPWRTHEPAPKLVQEMIEASSLAGVGPMAAVAGAIAACVGEELLAFSKEVMVENGGDIFLKTRRSVTIGVYAGNSPLSMQIGVRLGGGSEPMAVCTSSGTIGHSLSYGRADAVCVVAEKCALADAAATSIGNRVQSSADFEPAIRFGSSISGVRGIAVIAGTHLGCWGEMELVSVKKG